VSSAVLSNVLLYAGEVATGPSTTENANWFLRNAWIFPLIPAISFVLILFLGKRMPKKGAEIGIASVGICFLLAIATGVSWIDHRDNYEGAGHGSSEEHSTDEEHSSGEEGAFSISDPATGATDPVALAAEEGEEKHPSVAIQREVTWFQSGGVEFGVGILVDGMAVMMLFVVTLISLLVHIYSTDYVGGDRRYTHYFAFLSLFTASMLLLVLSSSTLQLITAWELVGVCSFALIGHWWEEKPNSDAALKAFLTNRVGDMGLLTGMIILFFTAGQTFNIVEINEKAIAGQISQTALLVASLCLIAAVMSKSGQFVLHTWLPDAMAGPTPVSALIHAATMVVAGIYMVARLYGVFFEGLSIGGSSVNALSVVGAVTLIGGGALAFVQSDIKKVLAYSTVSQLGYMAMALGVGAWTAALFHLFTHAFFKAGLFLGSGSVAHAVHSFDMKKDMGGLRKAMPITFWTFLICSLALVGIFPLSGFWSKDEILAGTGGWGLFGGTGGNGAYTTMLFMGIVGAAMTAADMTRCIYLTFFGGFRGHGHPHESGRRITVPLIILSVLAVGTGLLNLPKGLAGIPSSFQLKFEHVVEPVAPYFPPITHATPSYTLAIFASLVGLLGIALAYWYYFVKVEAASKAAGRSLTELPNGITTKSGLFRAGHTLLVNKYYFDHLYQGVIADGVKGPIARAAYWFNQNVLDRTVDTAGRTAVTAGNLVYRYVDQGLVEGVENGTGLLSNEAGQELRRMQTGRVQQYAAILFAAATVLAGIFIVIV
jgi:NADH-quinone oxidoreductase subunit L